MKIVKQELRDRVVWLAKIRLGFIGAFLAFFAVQGIIKWPEDLTPFIYVFFGVCAYEAAFLLYFSKKRVEYANAAMPANLQILLDFLALSALTYLSGGIFSPLSFFFIFHVIMAGILLSKENSFILSLLAVIMYSLAGLASYLHSPPHLMPIVEFVYNNPIWGMGVARAFVGTVL
mgnify:CR=1 FL=1